MDYQEVETKEEYLNLLYKVTEESMVLAANNPTIKIYLSIYNQLKDVGKLLSDGIVLTDEKIYARYSFGAIAVKNFDCDEDLYGRQLQDLFGGLFDYYKMPEK